MPVPMSRNWPMPASVARYRTALIMKSRLALISVMMLGRTAITRSRDHAIPGFPVGGEVVLAAEPVVIDPGRVRHAGVNLGGLRCRCNATEPFAYHASTSL